MQENKTAQFSKNRGVFRCKKIKQHSFLKIEVYSGASGGWIHKENKTAHFSKNRGVFRCKKIEQHTFSKNRGVFQCSGWMSTKAICTKNQCVIRCSGRTSTQKKEQHKLFKKPRCILVLRKGKHFFSSNKPEFFIMLPIEGQFSDKKGRTSMTHRNPLSNRHSISDKHDDIDVIRRKQIIIVFNDNNMTFCSIFKIWEWA